LGSYLPFHETWDVPHLIALTDAEIRAIHVADGHEDGDVSVDFVATCSRAASKLRASGELSAPATSSNSGEKVRELSVSNRVGSMIDDMLAENRRLQTLNPSCRTTRSLNRVKSTAENQYASLQSALSDEIHRQGWKVEQISFVTVSRPVNEQDLRKNLKFLRVPEASIQSVYSKLAMRVFDVYANILEYMYSTRFNGDATRSGVSLKDQLTPNVVTPLIHTLDTSRPDKYKRRGKESKEANDKYYIIYVTT
jgi:hypothetical protein